MKGIDINMIKKCYFYNVGTIFDKNDKDKLKVVWNYNFNCCKSDLCNGLNCESYGIKFDKDNTIDYVKDYVSNGVNGTYGYIKEIDIDLEKELWDSIYDNLKKDYYLNDNKLEKQGFIPFYFGEIIEDYSPFWEEPDISFLKKSNSIKRNCIHINKENELNTETIKWINDNL